MIMAPCLRNRPKSILPPLPMWLFLSQLIVFAKVSVFLSTVLIYWSISQRSMEINVFNEPSAKGTVATIFLLFAEIDWKPPIRLESINKISQVECNLSTDMRITFAISYLYLSYLNFLFVLVVSKKMFFFVICQNVPCTSFRKLIVNAERRCDLVIIFTILIFTICEKKKGLFGGFALTDIIGRAFSWINVLCCPVCWCFRDLFH